MAYETILFMALMIGVMHGAVVGQEKIPTLQKLCMLELSKNASIEDIKKRIAATSVCIKSEWKNVQDITPLYVLYKHDDHIMLESRLHGSKKTFKMPGIRKAQLSLDHALNIIGVAPYTIYNADPRSNTIKKNHISSTLVYSCLGAENIYCSDLTELRSFNLEQRSDSILANNIYKPLGYYKNSNRLLVSSLVSNKYLLLDAKTGTILSKFSFLDKAYKFAFHSSPAREMFACWESILEREQINIYTADKSSLLLSFIGGGCQTIRDFVFDPSGRYLAIAYADHFVIVDITKKLLAFSCELPPEIPLNSFIKKLFWTDVLGILDTENSFFMIPIYNVLSLYNLLLQLKS